MRNDASLTPVAMVVLAIALLSAMDAVIKQVAGTYPTWQIVMMRYLVGLAIALPLYLYQRPAWPDRSAWTQSVLRSLTALATAFCFFHALTLLPLAKAVALTFCAPLFLALLARLILHEPISGRALAAILLGFGGVLIMLWRQLAQSGGENESLLGASLALAASLFYALAIILTRLHGQKQRAAAMIFLQNIFTCLFAIPLGVAAWHPVEGSTLMLFLIIGALGTAGQFLMVAGFSRANAARLGPIEYTGLIWASLFGLMFFDEIPTTETLAGAGLIVTASLLATQRPRPAATPTD